MERSTSNLTPFERRRLQESQNHMLELKKIQVIASVLLQKKKTNVGDTSVGPVPQIQVSLDHNREVHPNTGFSVLQNIGYSPLKRKFSDEKLEVDSPTPEKKFMKFDTPSSSELLFLRVKSDSAEIETREKQLGELGKAVSLGTIQLALFEAEFTYRQAKAATNVKEDEKLQIQGQLLKLTKLIKAKKEEIENSKTKQQKLLEEVETCKKNFFDSLKKYNEERIDELSEK